MRSARKQKAIDAWMMALDTVFEASKSIVEGHLSGEISKREALKNRIERPSTHDVKKVTSDQENLRFKSYTVVKEMDFLEMNLLKGVG